MSFASLKQTKWVIPEQLPNASGSIVTITDTRQEMLKDFNTQKDENFLVLYFKEIKPLVCKNPVLDSLEVLFPFCDPPDIVGQQIVLHGVRGSSGSGDWHVVRIDEVASLRLQSPDNIPDAMKKQSGSHNEEAPATSASTSGGDPVHDEEPPPPGDEDGPL